MATKNSSIEHGRGQEQMSLSTAAARNLATTTKSAPQMQGITARWLLRMLPWEQITGGFYRVNRRLQYPFTEANVQFTEFGSAFRVIPQALCNLPFLVGFDDDEMLEALADHFVQQEHAPGEIIAEIGKPIDRFFLLARGKAIKHAFNYGHRVEVNNIGEGDVFGERMMAERDPTWEISVDATTPCTTLSISKEKLWELVEQSDTLRDQMAAFHAMMSKPVDKYGQADIAIAAGHKGEPRLPTTFVDYTKKPREYELSVAQTILKVHTRVADLFNDPMNQIREQLRLTIEALRERQEDEMINNPEFGLLHSVDPRQRLQTRKGPMTPDDMDILISRRRRTRLLIAHPRAIAAFGQECNRRGIYPHTIEINGQAVRAWRNIPLLSSTKMPISKDNTTSILAMRLGEQNHGVYGIIPSELPEQVEPGLNVRFMGISNKAIISYLVSAYYSVVVPIPNALGVMENIQLGG